MQVYDAAHALARDIRESEEYGAYARLKQDVMSDATNAALLKEYKRLQTALQMAAMAGASLPDEQMQRFSTMSSLLYTQQDIAAYLLAEMRLQKMMADVFKTLSDAADMQLELPG